MDQIKNYKTLKSELKTMALALRGAKKEIKTIQKEEGSGSAYLQQYKILGKKFDYRHKHIAYSMMRGKTYEQIERKCAKGNEPNQKLIQEILNAYARAEDVCAGA